MVVCRDQMERRCRAFPRALGLYGHKE